MNLKSLILTLACAAVMPATAQKRVFMPEDLRSIDFTCDSSRY